MSHGLASQKTSTDNSLNIAYVLPISLSTVLIICNITTISIFYRNRREPAFSKRKIKLTLSVCLLLNIPLLTNIISTVRNILILDIITQIIVLYCLFLTILRSWNLLYSYQIAQLYHFTTGTNFWLNNYYRLASKTFARYYCIISFLMITAPTVFFSLYFNNKDVAFVYIYILCTIYLICVAVIIKLLKYNIKMQDQLNLGNEIKIYSVISSLSVILMMVIVIISSPDTVTITHILVAVNVFILSISFILYPIYKYRKISSTESTQIQDQLVRYIGSNSSASLSQSAVDDAVDSCNQPTLIQFLSKNEKCYDHFKSHLQQSWAVENLLFFSDAQIFRAKSNMFAVPENKILKIRFDYLPKTETKSEEENERETIESEWFYIYNRYLSPNGIYQVNIESDEFEKVEQFKKKILEKDQIADENEYYVSLESALTQVWSLMEGLYLYFRLRNDYKRIIAYSYHGKANSEAEMETVVSRIEDFFDDL